MADGEQEPAAQDTPPAGGRTDPSLHELAGRVDRLTGLVEQLLHGGGGQHDGGGDDTGPDIGAQVREAVAEIRAAEAAEAEQAEQAQSVRDQLADLKAKVEQPPAEYRKVTNTLGWNRP